MNDKKTLVIDRELAHPLEKVWRAITQSHLLKEWLMDNDFQAKVGHHFNFRSQPMPKWDGVIECEVLAVLPMTKVEYTWNALGLESVVTITLEDKDGKTLLHLEQAGFRSETDAAYVGAGFGWKKFLGNLDGILAGEKA